MKATGIDVPAEIIKFLDEISLEEYKKLLGNWK